MEKVAVRLPGVWLEGRAEAMSETEHRALEELALLVAFPDAEERRHAYDQWLARWVTEVSVQGGLTSDVFYMKGNVADYVRHILTSLTYRFGEALVEANAVAARRFGEPSRDMQMMRLSALVLKATPNDERPQGDASGQFLEGVTKLLAP
jgi:hypothetical protein